MAARKAKSEMDSDETRRDIFFWKNNLEIQNGSKQLIVQEWWRFLVENTALHPKMPRRNYESSHVN